jgi:hypothetical protein
MFRAPRLIRPIPALGEQAFEILVAAKDSRALALSKRRLKIGSSALRFGLGMIGAVQASTRSLSRLFPGILSACNHAPTTKRDREACERNADCSANDFAHSIYYARVAIRREQLR